MVLPPSVLELVKHQPGPCWESTTQPWASTGHQALPQGFTLHSCSANIYTRFITSTLNLPFKSLLVWQRPKFHHYVYRKTTSLYFCSSVTRGSRSSHMCPSHIRPTRPSTSHCARTPGLTHFIFAQTVLPTTPFPVCLQYSGPYETQPTPAKPELITQLRSVDPDTCHYITTGWLRPKFSHRHCSAHKMWFTALWWKREQK